MINLIKSLFYVILICLVSQNGYAIQEFVIEDIRVKGLQRITPGTVFNYLPTKVGDTFDAYQSDELVKALFETGFFEDIKIERDGNILILILTERPAIGSISFSGNHDIESEDLIGGLRQIDFAEGRSFDRGQLEKLEQELRRQYNSLGKYAVKLESTVTELDDNRVAVAIDISEGAVAKIEKINIVGNVVYEEEELLELFKLSEPKLFSFFTKSDQYSRQKLTADLESLRSQYLNNGYINFNIDSTQVSITPDKKSIYVTINITEGGLFIISEVKLTSNLILSEQEFATLISVRKGDIFSRRELTINSDALSKRLGDDGYTFAKVDAVPEIDDDRHTVAVVFLVDHGKRAYVRRINFSGNAKTRDEVLRREMRQQEGAWISEKKVERGKVRLQRLGFFDKVNVETVPTPGTTDQVDVNYSVTEIPSGSLSLGLGFSQSSGITLQTSISQSNFLGSGKRINFTFNNSEINQRFGFGYLNPYYTVDGISRSFDVSYSKTDSTDANIVSFNSTVWGGGVGFGIPVTEYNTFRTNISYENTEIQNNSSNLGDQVREFIRNEGTQFNVFRWSNSLSLDTRNKAIFPDQGNLHRISVEITLPFLGKSLEFYRLGYKTQWFIPVFENYVFSLKGDIGYANSYNGSDLPFFENFYAGGPKSVRGYKENTLGPVDNVVNASGVVTMRLPIGGNRRLVSSAEFIFPLPFFTDVKSVKLSTFIDAGNIYGDEEDFDLGELRYSVGLSAIWISPFGLVSASIAEPFNDQIHDQIQNFQFTFGTSF